MRALRFVTAATMVIVALTQSGCGKKDGEEFIGNWEKLSGRGSPEMVISRNGDGNDFYVASKVPNLAAESAKDAFRLQRSSALYADGKLMMMAGVPVALTIDKSSGHLVAPGAEYQKKGN
ncbi:MULTISPECIES: hypothetical protein [Burkholderia]|uniref:hypothetical protein n=1 Tax=Burkholderia TaxID=32008 RepID=UPI00158A644B|nr:MULTISPECIES: hypothetical protein [Burkholderia]MBJ9920563.1 hypothetical protein [Burkholderia cenocepacia]MCA3785203.1 hypothetical protein [Burkholderia sp.]MCA3793074.1 hypothetical protein [Burkholderia sp.]MCA3804954.1 hypothetical protein [Burkholderia sp.]MCA3806727.1 hypothetical protein [Burkholderia sp.]